MITTTPVSGEPGQAPQVDSGGNGVGQNPYAFNSGIQDRATGFVKFGARWYNPVTGTWTQQDTLDSPLDPGNSNRYAFASGDPVNGSDPTGNIRVSCDDLFLAGAGATLVGTALAAIGVGVSASGIGAIVGGPIAAAGAVIGTVGVLDVSIAYLCKKYGNNSLGN